MKTRKHKNPIRFVAIFDLDETVIDSRHRTPNNADGTLNLDAYRANHNAENVAKDTLLPLAKVMQTAQDSGAYVIVLTARDMRQFDYDFLKMHGLAYDKIMSRDTVRSESHYNESDGVYKEKWIRPFLNLKQFASKPVVMFEDAAPVKSALRKYFPVLCAKKLNRKLAK